MKIDRAELLRYLGHKGQTIDDKLDGLIDKAIELVLDNIQPKHIFKKYYFENNGLSNTIYSFHGKDIVNHLKDCNEVYVFAATLGFKIEQLVRRLSVSDKIMALLVDAASICAIEEYCDEVCDIIQSDCKKSITTRFSCGYGDYPLTDQNEICSLLNTQKTIGVYVNEYSVMVPQKSVTAIVGVLNNSRDSKRVCINKCSVCTNKECSFRR